MTLRGLRQHLARLDLELAAEAALMAQAEALAEAAREAGAEGGEVCLGSTGPMVGWRSMELLRREVGGVGVPPRPVLAGVAMRTGELAATAVGAAVASALEGA